MVKVMSGEVEYLLNIVKYILNNENGNLPLPSPDIKWQALMEIAQRHNILNIVYYGLNYLSSDTKPDEKTCKFLHDHAMREIVITYNQIEATNELLESFDKEKIYVVAVKGICIKRYYPQLDMRTMKDIDILCQDIQQKQIHKVMSQLGYYQSAEGQKHDYYIRKPYICLEMHRQLVSAESEYSAYYDSIWDRLQRKDLYEYVYEMTPEDEYIFTLIHLVEHFRNGGVGIRFIMDIYIYNQMIDLNWSYIEEELKKLELWRFFENISLLAETWFGIEKKSIEDETIKKLSEYVISNGTFGSRANSASLAVASRGKNAFMRKALLPNLKMNLSTIWGVKLISGTNMIAVFPSLMTFSMIFM